LSPKPFVNTKRNEPPVSVPVSQGFLINSKPENACEPIAPPPLKDNSSGVFIVLIRRLECNFDIKVRLHPLFQGLKEFTGALERCV